MSHPPFSSSEALSDLTASILARTSGPACGRLRELACAFLDETLSAEDGELVSLHLEHCPRCRALVAGLDEATRVLPSFAQMEPGPEFTAAVLARTRSPLSPIHPPQDRLIAGWANLMRRPRAALEAAYLATAAGFILTQLPLPGSTASAGSAFISLARTEGRASMVRAATHGQILSRSTLTTSPIRILHARESAWTLLRGRFSQRFERVWRRLAKVADATWTRIWPRHKAPSALPTEPPKVLSRSAL
jgi:hypothetical protein